MGVTHKRQHRMTGKKPASAQMKMGAAQPFGGTSKFTGTEQTGPNPPASKPRATLFVEGNAAVIRTPK